jgi:hypothetical protein
MALTRVTSNGIAPGVEIKLKDNTHELESTGLAPSSYSFTPALSFGTVSGGVYTHDSNTGIYSPGADELAFGTAGSEKLRIQGDGKIILSNGASLPVTNPNFDSVNAKNFMLYVNQSDVNASDALNNDGGNLNRPFKTIERALLEAAKRSYISGENNDRFEAFTIMVMPGDYVIDNRPGVLTAAEIPTITQSGDTFSGWSNFENEIWKFNPRSGGVIVPRGTSVVGYDLRKTIIRPKYVPKPGEFETGLTINPAGDDLGGSIINDGLYINNILQDAANMVEKAKEYIQDQTKLFLYAEYSTLYTSLSSSGKIDKCVRDLGYFVDGLVKDLREGGNINSFNVGEFYTTGGDNDGVNELSDNQYLLTQDEKDATIAAFNYAKEMAIKAAHAWSGTAASAIFSLTDDAAASVTSASFTSDTSNSYAYTTITSSSNGTNTLTSSVDKPSYSANVDYSGSLNSSACAAVDGVITTLAGIVTGIISNPDTYTTLYNRTPGVEEQTAIFKVTGGCYFWQMTFKDAVGQGQIYKSTSYTGNNPTHNLADSSDFENGALKYSHHKVVAFAYANQRTTDGELETYYKKIDKWDIIYDGDSASTQRRFTRPEEYTIVGNSSVKTEIDTVSSCSPYVFNCSLRSTRGMCGMHADGSKVQANSFKSMVVAQFTGISLQRDENAFYQPKTSDGIPTNTTNPSDAPIYTDPDAEYKPEYRHYHIKASNAAFIQIVSVFAVGYADQFITESGGDMSITNSNSNFGHVSLRAVGHQEKVFEPANQGKITAVIPPRGISRTTSDVEFYGIDYKLTWQLNGQTSKTYNENIRQTFISGSQLFKVYLDIPGLNTEDDIPEFILEVEDKNPSATQTTVRKRFLTYGSNNNYLLFRDYYTASGVCDDSYATISATVEDETGASPTEFTANINLTKTDSTLSASNIERQGYYWDETNKKIYIEIDASTSQSDAFLTGFIFKYETEVQFRTSQVTRSDNSIQVITEQVNVNILSYYDGFPVSLSTKKIIDDRTSVPSDLIWRVEYTIPKNCQKTPKPPEKRFIIRGTQAGSTLAPDSLTYSECRFLVYDVEEVQSWSKNSRDGIYYLTVIRADIDQFAYNNERSTDVNETYTITRGSRVVSTLKGLYKNSNYRVASNINYLYPSTNEDGPAYINGFDSRGNPIYAGSAIATIWNPPQAESRVLIEKIDSGYRCKDLSVPNVASYTTESGKTTLAGAAVPFADTPSMYSITAEAVQRLVDSLGLYYAGTSSADSSTVKVAPVVSWSQANFDEVTSNTYAYSSTPFAVFKANTRTGTSFDTTMPEGDVLANNTYGINKSPSERKINVVAKSSTFSTQDALRDAGVDCPLYRPSIMRASSHTWEYVGLGSGNYSTGFPNQQTRVLKSYEQFIVQGYENGGGFVASSGTNSNGDFYVGNQVQQAGGTTTFTLNVPKVRKSSETNYVDISDIENRISNAVVNVGGSNKNASSQNFLKSLSNFFTTAKLNVSDRATIQTALIQDRLYLANTRISNGEKFPEGNTEGYGFTKAARSEKVGFISTDTNDRLYVSPKYLDAWRIKRQLLSATAVSLDNNRIYLQTPGNTLLDGTSTTTSDAVTTSSTTLFVKESAGLPATGQVDIVMNLRYVDSSHYVLDSTNKVFLNPYISLNLKYDTIDYTNNTISLSSTQNTFSRQTYLEDILGKTGTNVVSTNYSFNKVIKNWSCIIDDGPTASETNQIYLGTKLDSNFTVGNDVISPTSTRTITIKTDTTDSLAKWNLFPNRGAITLREQTGTTNATLKYATFVYVKSSTQGQLILIDRVIGGTNSNVNNTTIFSSAYSGNNVFFSGCDCSVIYADKWASEKPFIPNTETISEDVDLDSATLHQIPEKPSTYTGAIDKSYTDKNVPNPYSSKALGPSLQNRLAVKEFRPLATLAQAARWCSAGGFTTTDTVELLMKPGYYQIDTASFPCRVKINGTGVSRTGGAVGKETASVSAGRIGGYSNTGSYSTSGLKRADSVYFYRPIRIQPNYGARSNQFYVTADNNISSAGGFDLSNVHFISLGEAAVCNEILDSDYAGSDGILSAARQRVRKAWFVKKSSGFPSTSSGITGGLSFLMTASGAAGKGKMEFYCSTTTTNSSGDFTLPSSTTYTTGKYVKFTLSASNFTGTSGTPSDSQKYKWAKNYIIPGSTLYFIPGNTTLGNVTSSSKAVKIVEVNIKAKDVNAPSATSLEEIEFICSTTNGTNTNNIEDLILDSSTQNCQIVVVNQDGDEIPTLIFNWAYAQRKAFIPHDFAFGGSATSATSPNTVSDTGYVSTNITAGGLAVKRFDKPEIFGIIAGFSPGSINLVIDTNPTADSLKDPIDGSTLTSPLAPYPFASSYISFRTILLEYKDNQGEDAAIAIPYFPNGSLRIAGRVYSRFYLLQVNPNDIASNVENTGIDSTILSQFTNFNYSTLQANNSIAIIGGVGTLSGATTSFANLSEFVSVAKGNLAYTGITNPYKKATNRTQSLFNGAIQSGSYAVGKFNYIHYAYVHRWSRKRFISINGSFVGNIGGNLLRTDAALGGTSNICTLTNVTIGAQSPSDSIYNRTGGGWRGGLISAKGSRISLSGVRFRGNVTLDFTGLVVNPGGDRVGTNYTYGHSVEVFQVEDEAVLSKLGGSNPASFLSVSKNDEQFKYLYENKILSNLYLEPFRTPYGEVIDYDRRTFPISCYQALKRFTPGTTDLNTSVTINERYQTPYRIIAGTTHNSATDSGTHLRINRSASVTLVDKTIIGASTPIIIPPRSIAFKYYNDDVINNIFYGEFATKVIRASNQFTTYGNVTKINDSAAGSGTASNSNPKVAVITLSSAIPTEILGYYSGTATPNTGSQDFGGVIVSNYIEVTNSADYTSGTSWDDTNSIKFLTLYLNSTRYNYITTATSRYEKTVDSARSYLRLNSTGTPVYAIHSDIKITSSNVPNLTKGSTPIEFTNTKSGTTPLKAFVTTNSAGAITSFDIVSYGSGHLKDNILTYTSGSNKIELKCLRSLEGNIELFDTGEFMVVPPRHCFVLNNINANSLVGVKQELQKAKSIIKPFSYIRLGTVYYKIANDATNEPYICVYSYVNEVNLADVRYSIVVRLEDNTYAPTYPATQRMDVFELETILDYWPTSGRVQLGDVEIADFTKGTYADATGYPLTITRSNTKYWPSYIRDFEGLDPETEDVDVSVEQFVPTTIALADPVDLTCAGLRKIASPSTDNGTVTITVPEYITPDGKKTTDRLVIKVPTTASTQVADAKKYNIGDIIHIPYRRTDADSVGTLNVYKISGYVSGTSLTVSSVTGLKAGMTLTKTAGTGVFAASTTISSINATTNTITLNTAATTAGAITFNATSGTGTWEDIVCTVVADTETDSSVVANKAGSTRIKVKVNMSSSGQSISWTNPTAVGAFTWFHIVPSTSTNSTIYGKVNPIGVVRFQNTTSSISYAASPATVNLICSSALLANLSADETFSLVPMFKTLETTSPVRVFKSRIVDIEIPSSDTSTIRIHTADPAPELWTDGLGTSANFRHYGFFFVNHNGWTYPRNGGSSVRVNNVVPGTGYTQAATGTSGSSTITLTASNSNILVGMSVTGTGIGNLAKVTAISGTTVTLSVANSGAVSGTITFGSQNLVKLPNFNDRIKIGDILRYSFEEVAPSGTITATIANSTANNVGNILTLVTPPTTGSLKPGMFIYGEGLDEGTIIEAQLSSTTFRLNNSYFITTAITIYPYSSPSAQYQYTGTVVSVGTKDSTTGYSEILLSDNSGTRHILDTAYSNKSEWSTIDDIFISHRSDNFTEDGPIASRFMYSGNGVKLSTGSFSLWYENYANYLSGYNGIVSRQGWVGNWGLSRTGESILGFDTVGSSNLVYTNQYNDTIWISAQPTIPLYWGNSTLIACGSDINTSVSLDTLFTTSDNGLPQYNYGIGTHRQQVIQHTSLLTDDIYTSFNTSAADSGGHDALDISRYQLSSKPTLEYVLRDAVISQNNATSAGGAITPGTGKNRRLFEQLICDYTTYYKPVNTFDSVNTYTTTSYSQLKIACNSGEYSWKAAPIQIATTGVTTSGGYATFTFATQTSAPYSVGQTITISGVTPTGYNGVYTVVDCTTTTVVVQSSTTGAITVQGAITSSIAATATNLVGLSVGDAIYTEAAGTYVGTIASINSDGLGGTFVQPALAAVGSVGYASPFTITLGNIRVLSPRATRIAPSLAYTSTLNPTSNTSVGKSGTTGTNIIAPSQPHFNQYNFRYSLERRNYNATPLVNTEGIVRAVNTYNFASDSVNVAIGDICRYKSSLLNVQITRLNSKVHIERSITVAGRPVFNI